MRIQGLYAIDDKTAGEGTCQKEKSTALSMLPPCGADEGHSWPVGRRELCDYVADFASEFHQVASSNDMRFLSYLLAMVVEEAVHQSNLASDRLLAIKRFAFRDILHRF